MKKKHTGSALLFILIYSLLALTFASCKTQTVYVPVETIKTEYKDRIQKDSVHLYDSIFVDRFFRGDTVFLTKEKYKYLYRDKLVRDSVFITDSIQVPYPVKGDTQYVNRLRWWQTLLMILGAVGLGLLLYKIYSFFKFS
ncbi:MAG TPA: hypothetical protein DIT04_10795 [Dysgonomonas sp.]|nr:hypothetical protein [Dysgonomonas sp.]